MRYTPGRFLFLSNPKCGSTSVRHILDSHSTFRINRPADGWHPHFGARRLKQILQARGEEWPFSFTTIRNPWDRMVSAWTYAARQPQSFWARVRAHHPTFEDFVRHAPDTMPAAHFCSDADQTRLVDEIIPVEQLDTLLPLTLERLGIPTPDVVPHVNRTEREHYRHYYTDESRAFVAQLFISDIELGAYKF